MILSPNFFRNGTNSDDDVGKIYPKIDQNSKTHDAYLKLIGKGIDIILVSTPPSNDELKEAKAKGIKLEITPIGLDGFVFLVNDILQY
jgi:ABC-type phosphate transport system substrate-binding protein